VSPDQVRTVACVGAGVIGGGWVAYFLAHGFRVRAWDPAADAEARLRTLVRADAVTPLSGVALAVRAAQDRHAAAELVAAGGTALARAWADLAAADDDVRAAVARLAAARADSEMRRRRGRSAAERLADLLRRALAPPPPSRRPTKPTKGSQRRRLKAKKERGATKALRGRVRGEPG
jgi:3-hydroxyacyl-CoA dehydrogenase